MSEVFISYKREDEPRVDRLARGLRKAGLSVWLDLETPGGASWRQTILEQLEAARCVVVVWSESSVSAAGEFVHDEASRAKQRGVLLPVRIDPVEPPIGFGEIQSLELVGWSGNPRDPRFRDVVAAAKAIAAGGGRPRPRAPARRRRIAAAVVSGGTALITIAGLASDVAGMQGAVCRVPGVRALCRTAGLGGVPSEAEEEAWASREAGDCEALRSYLERFPYGAYAEEAQRRLQAAKTQTRERWAPEERRLPLVVRRGIDSFGNEEAARQDALSRGLEDARMVCAGFDAGEFRLLATEADPRRWRCSRLDAGTYCGFDGEAVCRVEVRRLDNVEICP